MQDQIDTNICIKNGNKTIKTISVKVVENSHASLLIPSLSVLSVIWLGNSVPDNSTLSLISYNSTSFQPFAHKKSKKCLQVETMLSVIWLGNSVPDNSTLSLISYNSTSFQPFAHTKSKKCLQVETMLPIIRLGHTVPDYSTLFYISFKFSFLIMDLSFKLSTLKLCSCHHTQPHHSYINQLVATMSRNFLSALFPKSICKKNQKIF